MALPAEVLSCFQILQAAVADAFVGMEHDLGQKVLCHCGIAELKTEPWLIWTLGKCKCKMNP